MRQRRGFTLVEVLMVIGITALLIGLLVPALSKARAAAQMTTCAVNLAQLGQANATYAAEHRGNYAPGAAEMGKNLKRWHGTRDTVYEPFKPEGGSLSSYIGTPFGGSAGTSTELRSCPSLRIVRRDPTTDFEACAGGYGYNNAYVGVSERGANSAGGDERGCNEGAVTNPSLTAMFGDSGFVLATVSPRIIEYSFIEPPRHRDDPAWPSDPSVHFRHNERANVVWADGAVIPQECAFSRPNIYGVTQEQMREMNVGFFGPDNNTLFDLD